MRPHPKWDASLYGFYRWGYRKPQREKTDDCDVAIYALVDTRDMTVRYVGQTMNPGKRHLGHLSGAANKSVREWMAECKRAGHKPLMMVLDWVPVCSWEKAEREWISYYASQGSLYNVHSGGNLSWLPQKHEALTAYERQQVYRQKQRRAATFLATKEPLPSADSRRR